MQNKLFKQEGWVETSKRRPRIGDSVEYSEDGISVDGTLVYTDERHYMVVPNSNCSHVYGEGFATDGRDGVERGLVCDDPKYWRLSL